MKLIDGKACAQALLEKLHELNTVFIAKHGRAPKLNIVRINDDFGSIVYTENKINKAKTIDLEASIIELPKDIDQASAIECIYQMNQDPSVDGIIIQLPLPNHLDKDELLNVIDPSKDVDGLTNNSMGMLLRGQPNFVACTPQGISRLAKSIGYDFRGKDVVILGQSIIVGRPMALVCLNQGATVTICHSATERLDEKIKSADVLISAMGVMGVVDSSWLKPNSVVFDVAINRLSSGKITGDIEGAKCDHVGFLTPVPGGVGPMTVACLMNNTLLSAVKRVGDKALLEELNF
jgi:methylenetetrahydrofolate dehydrogenase (NADP+)/methenyltetrahydrofolate cyclohydrolase